MSNVVFLCEGIRMGDIGEKLGANSTDNGYMILERVRIPRLHMFMKNAMVICRTCVPPSNITTVVELLKSL